MPKKDIRRPLSRQERLENRYKDTLRCEWCNLRTLVDHKFWVEEQEMNKDLQLFNCDRPRCLHTRPEGWTWGLAEIAERRKEFKKKKKK